MTQSSLIQKSASILAACIPAWHPIAWFLGAWKAQCDSRLLSRMNQRDLADLGLVRNERGFDFRRV